MTKDELDAALYKVDGFIPKIVVGPGHWIGSYEGFSDPRPGYYRGVPVFVHDGWGERCAVLPFDADTP